MTWLGSGWLPSVLPASPAGQGGWEPPAVGRGTSSIEDSHLRQDLAGRMPRGEGRLRGPAAAVQPRLPVPS